MALVEVNEVSKKYNTGGTAVAALKRADLCIEEGEMIALMGPSGSGKSTLLTILGAMNPPSTGSLIIDDINVYKLSTEKLADFRHEYLGFVFQQLQLIPYLTAIENVMLPLAISKYPQKVQEEMAMAALDRVGLAGLLKRLPNQLSGGEQERVAIARAIVNNPPIVLADEPTGSLDSKTGDEVMALFQSLNEDGQTIVIVTHNPDNRRYVERTVFIRDGMIVGEERKGEPENISFNPALAASG